MNNPSRTPAVAGQFYAAHPESLTSQVEQYVDETLEKQKCIGIISPHAGLMYSGSVAGALYSNIRIPDTVLLIGPNHTGLGMSASIMVSGQWQMPTGTFNIDTDFATSLSERTAILSNDTRAHQFEHSLEVQLPFINHFRSDVKIVPVTLMVLKIDECRELGKAIADTIRTLDEESLIVASSDMSHYVSDDVAREKDNIAIAKIKEMDPVGLYDVIKRHHITMCGFIPATVMLFAALNLGARHAELIKYTTSAEVSGDFDHVVGYAGIVVR